MAVRFSTIHRWDFCRALYLPRSDDKIGCADCSEISEFREFSEYFAIFLNFTNLLNFLIEFNDYH